MAFLEIAGRRVDPDLVVRAGHLALFYTDDAGQAFVLSASTDDGIFSGDLVVETFDGNPWVPRAISSESAFDDDDYDTVLLDLGVRDATDVAGVMAQYAMAMNGQDLDYLVLEQNSNSVIASLLDLVGLDVDDVLPDPPGVGWPGFVARDTIIEFDYTIQGSASGDLLRGRDDDQTFFGNDGDDTLIGGQGNDWLDGGAGTDMAQYAGVQSSYTLTIGAEGITLEDRRPDRDGVDMLTDVELLDFDTDLFGGPFDLRVFGGAGRLSSEALTDLIELYIAYFNRAPDAVGLNFWGTALADGVSLEAIAGLFNGQNETRATYAADLSNDAFATAVYANVLGRVADPAGLGFWIDQLDRATVSRDQFILAVLQGVNAPPPADATAEFLAQQQADRDYLSGKASLGALFAVHLGLSDVTTASEVMALFDGTSPGFDSAVAATNQHHATALDPFSGEFLMPLIGVLDVPGQMDA